MPQGLSLISITALIALALVLSAALRERAWLRYFFLLRVPLLGIVSLVLVAVLGPKTSVLAGLLVMQWDGFLALTYFLFLAVWTCGFTAEITWRLAPERFGVSPPVVPGWLSRVSDRIDRLLPSWLKAPDSSESEPRFLATRHLPWSSLAALPLWIAVLIACHEAHAHYTTAEFLLRYLGAGAVGLISAILTLVFILWIRTRISRDNESGTGGLAHLFNAFAGLRPGYLYRLSDGRVRFTSGHAMGAALAMLALAIYFLVIFLSRPDRSIEHQLVAMHSLLIFLTLVVLVLAGVTFFFDRYRVPVLLVLVLVVIGVGGLGSVDYRFDLWKPDQDADIVERRREVSNKAPSSRRVAMTPATATQVVEPVAARLKARSDDSGETLIVIAAAGGGIQAAAWTARVLTGLGEEIGPVFGESVGLISSVSGGSVGALYWVEGFCDGKPPPPEVSRAIFDAASHPSLQATLWALLFTDLPRLVWPFGSADHNRAWAMERSWEMAMNTMLRQTCPSLGDPSERPARRLSEWIAETQAGFRPAVIMNSFLTSSGRRLLIGSTSVPLLLRDSVDFRNYCCLYQDPADIDLVTAARVSATFPWVTPQARPRWVDGQDSDPYPLPSERLADGGYYDNSGIITATDWLMDADLASNPRFHRVALIEIDPFPKSTTDEGEPSGLAAETLGPLQALLRGRTRVQRDRADQSISKLRGYFNTLENPDYFQTFVFRPPELARNANVLSWHLSPTDKKSLLAAWDKLADDPNSDLARLRRLFN